jgi:hypothetical protein
MHGEPATSALSRFSDADPASEQARANVMRGMIAHVTSLYGEQAIPAFVLGSICPIAAA